jgi:hypothetical protein
VQHVFVDGHDVPTRAQATIARALHQDGSYTVVVCPGKELPQEQVHHPGSERIDGPGPVQGDHTQPSALLEEHVGASAPCIAVVGGARGCGHRLVLLRMVAG